MDRLPGDAQRGGDLGDVVALQPQLQHLGVQRRQAAQQGLDLVDQGGGLLRAGLAGRASASQSSAPPACSAPASRFPAV